MNAKQTNAELIDYKFQIVNEGLNAHRQETKEEFQKLHSKMDAFIEASKRTYATKEEHEENRRAIEEMQKEQRMFITKALVSFGAAIIAGIIWVSDIILKKLGII